MAPTPNPRLGLPVLYRTDGRNGLTYDLPAIVNCTADSHPGDYPRPPCPNDTDGDGNCGRNLCPGCGKDAVPPHNPLPVPEQGHAHLTVFTAGGFGTEVGSHSHQREQPVMRRPHHDKEFVGAPAIKPGSGTYVELNVPHVSAMNLREGYVLDPDGIPRRSWRVDSIQEAIESIAASVMGGTAGLSLGEHFVDIHEMKWTMQHPLTCRPNLMDCDLHERFTLFFDEFIGHEGNITLDGRYKVSVGSSRNERQHGLVIEPVPR